MTGVALMFTSCVNQFNQIYKSSDNDLKYEYAKECYLRGKYVKATTLLQELVTIQKGTDNAEESLYMLAMAGSRTRTMRRQPSISRNTLRHIPRAFMQSLLLIISVRAFI